MRLRLALAAVLATLACAPSAQAFSDAAGLHVTGVKQIDPRLYALTVRTAALPGPAHIYVLLPPSYSTERKRRWPVLYLLHGTSGYASDWTKSGAAEQVIGNRPLITVMPDIGLNGDGGGWCTDWPNGAERWETFHISQLVPWVDANLRTRPSRQGRAIAGLSQGGFCALSYSARHPDIFGTALGYSAAPDIYYDAPDRLGAVAIINGTEIGLTRVPPNTFFGNPATNGINWAAHDPATLAPNLRWTHMYMYWGNGLPGPFDPEPISPLAGGSEIEAAVNQSNLDFEKRIEDLAIPAFFDAYGNGTHKFPYWKRDLQWSIDKVMLEFDHPRPLAREFTYTSADDQYAVYDWRVRLQRPERAFSTLHADGCRDFEVDGSGRANVTTPACLRRGARYVATISGPGGVSARVVRAGSDGRLTLDIDAGARVVLARSR